MHLARSTWIAAAAFVLTVSTAAAADSSSGDRAVAEALFNEGVALIAAGDVVSGCAKLEGSQALDPALGTALRLADCYERVGKTASAWALFKHAEGIALRQGERDRESIARARADALTPRLSYLVIRAQGDVTPGLSITKNETVMPLSSVGVAIPVDPGVEVVTANAPGYLPWSGNVDVPPGPGTQVLEIPPLQVAPAAAPVPVTAASPAPTWAPRPAAASTLAPARAASGDVAFPTSTRKAIGVAAISVGGIGVLTGLGFGLYAKQQNDDSRRHCPFDEHNGCTSDGIRLRQRAEKFALASTLTTVGSAAVLGTGVVLWLTAPTASKQASAAAIRWTAAVTPRAFTTTVGGGW